MTPGLQCLEEFLAMPVFFSDATDLAILLQLFLNNGEYGSKQYFLPSTIREFTRVQFPAKGNRRALGFDKPVMKYLSDGPCCKSASQEVLAILALLELISGLILKINLALYSFPIESIPMHLTKR